MLATILHELITAARDLTANRKGELHALVDTLEKPVSALEADVAAAEKTTPAETTTPA